MDRRASSARRCCGFGQLAYIPFCKHFVHIVLAGQFAAVKQGTHLLKQLCKEVPHIAGAGGQQDAQPRLNAVDIAANIVVLLDGCAVAAVAKNADHSANGGVTIVNRTIQVVFIELDKEVEQGENALVWRY